jgi:predicted DCC family thiol-disulfide oxidoreductase YuxK
MENNKSLILFDGVCNLCNSSVQFILLRDKKDRFRFASLQSDYGQSILKQYNLPTEQFDSLALVENGKLYKKSSGALRIARRLNSLWPMLYAFIIVPPFIRNFVYDFIAKNRYRWFGKKEECMLPRPEWRQKFLG